MALNDATATFLGLEPVRDLAVVFALLVRHMTGGQRDGIGNPLGVQGAGWAGFVGFDGDSQRAVFNDPRDGCLAAAVVLQSDEYALVLAAYAGGDPVAFAAALAVSPLSARAALGGLRSDVLVMLGRGTPPPEQPRGASASNPALAHGA